MKPRIRRRPGMTPAIEGLETLQLLSVSFRGGVWAIQGTRGPDTISVERAPDRPELLRAIHNGKVVGTRLASRVREIRLDGGAGDDTLQINESGGAIKSRVILRGGAGVNWLLGGSGVTLLDGGPGSNNVLQPGTGRTTLRRGLTADSARPFGSVTAFRQFLAHAATRGQGQILTPFRMANPQGLVTFSVTAGPRPAPESGGDSSGTNVQVAGVDEADIVETDGSSLFIISRDELVIVDARAPESLTVASRTKLTGSPIAEYLDGSRLTVLSLRWRPAEIDPPDDPSAPRILPAIVWGRSLVQVTTFDVSDPTRPRMLVETTLDGNYVQSRMIDGQLMLVLQNDPVGGGGWFTADPMGGGVINPAPGADFAYERLLPTFASTAVAADGSTTTRTGQITPAEAIYRPIVGEDTNLLTLARLDTRSGTPGLTGSAALMGSYASTLHVTADQVFVFSPRWSPDGQTSTSVFAFDLDPKSPALIATGTVPGSLVDPYSADFTGGYLRVATSVPATASAPSSSGVHVLRQDGDRLNIVGSVTGIAPGQRIFAARFQGDRVFVVTFEQVDPLWAIDLSAPESPRIVGKLELPGFSRFLQPVGPGLLVGIGRDVDPATGRATILKLSLFDVADLAHPRLVDSQTLDSAKGEWESSAAEWDPHAFGWYPELGVLAIPVTSYEPIWPEGEGLWRGMKTVSEMRFLQVDPQGGEQALRPIGAVDHDSSALRSVRVGNVLFSIADGDVKSVRVVDAVLEALGATRIQDPPVDWSQKAL